MKLCPIFVIIMNMLCKVIDCFRNSTSRGMEKSVSPSGESKEVRKRVNKAGHKGRENKEEKMIRGTQGGLE